MKTDVAGRVKNTPLAASKPLLPLYEAVVNSIQAIQEAKEQNGRIGITIVRDNNHLLKDSEPTIGEIIGFEVHDNGIGFNDQNYHAFETSDTTYKANRGGKGIGRFLWLVAFDRVEVVSHFKCDGKIQCRRFDFVPAGDGIKDMKVEDSTESYLPLMPGEVDTQAEQAKIKELRDGAVQQDGVVMRAEDVIQPVDFGEVLGNVKL